MKVACPGCKREYPVPAHVDLDAPFRCKCGYYARLRQLVDPASWQAEQGGRSNALVYGAVAVVVVLVLGLALWRREPEPLPEVAPEVELPEGDPLAGVDGKAELLIRRGAYVEALQLYTDLSEAVRQEHAEAIREREERLLTLIGDELLAKAAAARTPEAIRTIGPHLEQFLRRWRPGRELEVLARVEAAVDELRGRLRELEAPREAVAATKDAPTLPPEPPERAAWFEEQATRARQRVQELRDRIAMQRLEQEAERKAAVLRARDASRRRPLDLTIAGGVTLRGVALESYDLSSVVLANDQQEVTLPWSQLAPQVAFALRSLAARPDHAEDFLRLGTWCLKHRLFDEAERAFQRAVALDGGYAAVVPDLARVRAVGEIFAGNFERSGNTITVGWGFDDPREARDWSPGFEGVGVTPRHGRLEVSGKGFFLAGVDSVGFAGRAEVTAIVGPTSKGDVVPCLALGFGMGTAREQIYLVDVYPEAEEIALFVWGGGQMTPVARKTKAISGKRPKLTLRVHDGRLQVIGKGKVQLERKVRPDWSETRAFVGGVAPQEGIASFEAISVSGRVRAAWLRKAFGELEAAMFKLLREDDLPLFARRGRKPKVPTLSADDKYGLLALRAEDRAVYDDARKRIHWNTLDDNVGAKVGFERVLAGSPNFAAARYGLALAKSRLGERGAAIEELARAVNLCPRFYEAHALAGLLLVHHGKPELGLEQAERALEIRPDYAPALMARGLARFHQGQDAAALADLELARAIDPWDDEVVELSRCVATVIRGPPWQRRFRAETPHYVVETNVSQQRAETYGRHLEAIRALYVKVFDAPDRERPPSRVLIFDTQEGFHSYSELSIDDRMDSALGYYSPMLRQLLLYEDEFDETQAETLETLYHEGFHQFLHSLLPEMALPSWFDEGLAEYFAGSELQPDGSLETGRIVAGRQALLEYIVQSGQPHVPFPQLMRLTQAEFYANAGVCYAQAWSMIHFFRRGAPRPVAEGFLRYIDLLKQGLPNHAALEVAFDGIDWTAVEAAWRQYVASGK